MLLRDRGWPMDDSRKGHSDIPWDWSMCPLVWWNLAVEPQLWFTEFQGCFSPNLKALWETPTPTQVGIKVEGASRVPEMTSDGFLLSCLVWCLILSGPCACCPSIFCHSLQELVFLMAAFFKIIFQNESEFSYKFTYKNLCKEMNVPCWKAGHAEEDLPLSVCLSVAVVTI